MADHIEVLRMQADLRLSVRPPVWPAGVRTTPWQGSAAADVHALLRAAYARGGGEVEQDYARWLQEFTADSEFDPSSCIPKDLCVYEGQRGRGLGEALLRAAMALFANRGAPTLNLKVVADNPSGAQRLYLRCGFEVVERIEHRQHV